MNYLASARPNSSGRGAEITLLEESKTAELVDLLLSSAEGRELTQDEAWDYGWSQESYRRSPNAAMTHRSGANVKLRSTGLSTFERAVATLLRQPQIRALYDPEELWSISASLVGGLPLPADRSRLAPAIERWLGRVLDPPQSIVVFPVANVDQMNGLIDIGHILVGHYGELFRERASAKAGRDVMTHISSSPWWMTGGDGHSPRPILFACVCRSQLGRAIEEAGETFEDLVGIALMAQADLNKLSLYSLRGNAYRPGMRGLDVDRMVLARAAEKDPNLSSEIGCPILVDGVFGQSTELHWYGENPFPLEMLLGSTCSRSVADRLLTRSNAVENRLKVAAQWHANAHWSIDASDAVLALGVCFDSMLSEQGPTPGRVLSERFALLDPNPSQRHARYKVFQREYYPARSSVAHGGKKKSFDSNFVRQMAADARWAFLRIVELTASLTSGSENEYGRMYDVLKWGGASSA